MYTDPYTTIPNNLVRFEENIVKAGLTKHLTYIYIIF
jgi:hypothetical protein